jgi:DMSO/TMAO reductase YedYZ molybdopterin-dependent catalytic subunit
LSKEMHREFVVRLVRLPFFCIVDSSTVTEVFPEQRPMTLPSPDFYGVDTAHSRRRWLERALSLAAGSLALAEMRPMWARAEGDAPQAGLIVRSSRPLDLETPRSALATWRTPNDLFFVRSHLGEPAMGLQPSTLSVAGLAVKPLTLSLEALRDMKQVTVPAVLQCSGNGRSHFSPTVPGLQWECGAVGNAEWTGVPLADLLEKAGMKSEAKHVHFLGADAPPNPKTPQYLRSLPIEKALEPTTIVALAMNGEPLPWLHGGPLRLVVPSWTGNHWIKWLRSVAPAREEAPGFYQQTGYRIPRHPAPPGAVVKPEDLIPLTTMNAKSLMAWPTEGARLPAGKHALRGVAWTGPGFVKTVEVAIGADGPWQRATLENDERPGTWRVWRFDWDARTLGRYEIRVRATDSNGDTQPDTTPWNRSGYLWNGIEKVHCEIA